MKGATMKTKIIVGCLVGAAALGTYALTRSNVKATPIEPVLAASDALVPVPVVPEFTEATRCHFAAGYLASYDYAGNVDSVISMQGMPEPMKNSVEFQSKLAFEFLAREGSDTVLLGQMRTPSDTLTKMHGEKFATPFLVKIGSGCDVKAMARLKTTSLKSAQAQQVMIHDLFFKVPSNASGDVSYENGTGLAKATVSNQGGVISRVIKSYDMAWRMKGTFQVTSSAARVVLNDSWIESFQSTEGIAGGMLTSAVSTVSLIREKASTVSVEPAASRKQDDYQWTNLLSGTFPDVDNEKVAAANIPQQEQRYVELTKNATMEDTFVNLAKLVENKANIDDQWHEMAGFLNGHPEQISDFAQGIKSKEFPDHMKAVSYMVLSKTVHPEARNELMALRNDTTLHSGDRIRASLALVTRKDVGVVLAKQMKRDALQKPTGDAEADLFPRNSLLHLGVLAGAHKTDAETMDVALETVKGELSAAGEDTYLLSPALGAAGNLGELALLPNLQAYAAHQDYHVRELVPKSLRGYTYAQTENLWAEWLARETHPDVKEAIFDIIYHQLAMAQRNAGPLIINEAMKHIRMKPMVLARQSIIHLLGPVKNEYKEVKALLIEQMAYEFRENSGLYSQICNYLAPAEIELGLSRMPEFAHQYGAQQKAQAEQNVRDLEAKQPVKRVQGFK
jgi:hypothetical protein